jgi:hypothetical protein
LATARRAARFVLNACPNDRPLGPCLPRPGPLKPSAEDAWCAIFTSLANFPGLVSPLFYLFKKLVIGRVFIAELFGVFIGQA